MYQLEVKLALVRLCFNPANGWAGTVDVDAMERARGGQHSADKAERAEQAESDLRALGVTIGPHPLFGRVDVVAEHPTLGLRLIEVEGDSSRQREEAVYSALGQLMLVMKVSNPQVRYGLAVPSSPQWIHQLRKVPPEVTGRLAIDLYAVAPNSVAITEGGVTIPKWGR